LSAVKAAPPLKLTDIDIEYRVGHRTTQQL